MSRTVQQLMAQSLGLIGAHAAGASMSSDEASRNLANINLMLKSWGMNKLNIPYLTLESHTLVAGTDNYTIGSGGTINTARPIDIEVAWVRDSSSNDYPVRIITEVEFYRHLDRALVQSIPRELFYDKQTTLGIIYLYQAPDSSDTYTLWFKSRKQFTEFSAITETVTLPEGIEDTIVYMWAVRVAPFYNRPVPPEVAAEAVRLYKDFRNNYAKRPSPARFDFSPGGGFDTRTGDFIGRE